MRLIAVVVGAALVACFSKPPEPAGATDAPSGGGITFVQSNGDKALAVPSLAVAFLAPVGQGDLVVLAVSTYMTAIAGIADTAGNQYLQAGAAVSSPAGGVVQVFYTTSVQTSDPLIVTTTVTDNASNEVSVAIHDYRGADPSAPFDQANAQFGSAADPTSSGTVTATASSQLYFGALSHDATVLTTPATGFELRELVTDDNLYVPLATEDMIGPAQTIDASFTLSGPSSWACAIAVFR